MTATSAEAVLAALETAPDAQETAVAENAPTIVCVTACPAGIAHTYMAAEYLEKAGRKLGVNVVVEKGANGIEGRITAQQLQEAKACIFAAEVAIKERERFQGSLPFPCPSRNPCAMRKRSLSVRWRYSCIRCASCARRHGREKCVKTELKQALLSGISFAVPLIVAGGTVLAVSVLLAQITGLQHLFDQENSWLWMYRKLGGGMLGILMVPVLAAYTAYSLADKPALTPGFAAGLAANMIGSGFLGAIVGGLIAGYLMRWVKNHIRLSSRYNGFLTFYLYPVIGVLGAGSLMLFVIGEPVAGSITPSPPGLTVCPARTRCCWGDHGLYVLVRSGRSGQQSLLRVLSGGDGQWRIRALCDFASVKMVSAFTVTASTMLARTCSNSSKLKPASPRLLGLAGITEGAIPMAIEDPLRVIGSFVLGSMATGAIVGAMGIGLSTPGAGIFSLFLLHDAGLGGVMAAAGWFGAALIGAAISTLILLLWRRRP